MSGARFLLGFASMKYLIVAALLVAVLAPAGRAEAYCYEDPWYGWYCYPECGDYYCDYGEDASSCPSDCPCGDGYCSGYESAASCPQDCATTNRIIYIHGRDYQTWPTWGFVTDNPAWTNVALQFNGNNRMDDGYARTVVRDALISHCGTHTPNQCVIISASAGAPRVLLGIHDAQALGYSLRIPWQGHYASAEGGTEVADKWTRGWRRVVAKLFGRRRKVDDDLTVNRLRSDYWYIHYSPQQPVYMQAGSRDDAIYKGWGFKIRGNGYMPCGMGDGKVPVHSAGGYAYQGCNFSMCDGTDKYPWRTSHQCSLIYYSHIDAIARSLEWFAAPMVYGTPYYGDCSPEPEDYAGVPDASTLDDSADVAGSPAEDVCDRHYCMTNGAAICDTYDPPDRAVDTCLNGTCFSSGPVCGDYVCEGNEYYDCCWDCNGCYWYWY